MTKPVVGRSGAAGSLLLALLFVFPSPQGFSANLLLGSGAQSNHLLILFAPGQALQYELRHDGSIQNGQQLLAAVIEATGGTAVTTPAHDSEGVPVPFADQLAAWNGQGLFAHWYDYGRGVFVNGFASGSLAAAADGSWTSYFTYQTGGATADFTLASVGAKDRMLLDGDHDAYVLTSTHSFPGLAAWNLIHGITDLQADPDGDGMSNLFEYALRRKPHQPDARGTLELGRIEINGIFYLTLTYRRPHGEWEATPEGADAGYDGVGYTVETSTDLHTWQSGPNHVTQTVTPDPTGPMATVVARAPVNAPKRFLRLRVYLP